MKHTQKIKLARKLAKRGAKKIFSSNGWLGRREVILKKEAKRAKVNN